MRRALAATLLAACAVLPRTAAAQRAPQGYPPAARPVRSSLAPPVVGESELDRNDEARRVAELLRLMPGHRIAVLEAGTGYYAIRFARALGPATLVQAVDADPSDVAVLEQRALDQGLVALRVGVSRPDDPRLPAGTAEIALVADGYATLAEPYAYFAALVPMLRGGRLAVVALDVDVRLGGVPLAVARCELEAVGYRLDETYRLVPADRYLAVFTPPDEPRPAAAVRPCGPDGVPGAAAPLR